MQCINRSFFVTGGWTSLHEAEAVKDELENSWDPVEFRLTKVSRNSRITSEARRGGGDG